MPPRLAEKIGLLLILALAVHLRLTQLAHNPGWYTDEATHLDIAQHLLQGQTQYLAINQSYLLFGRMPLFEWLLAGALTLGGDGLTTLRTLTGALGVATVGGLYWAVRPLSRQLALLAALLLALYPPAVLYSRFGFSYNLLAPLVLITWRGLWSYWLAGRRRWLAVSALVAGLGLLSDLWMGVLMLPILLVTFLRRWRDTLWVWPVLVLPLGLYTASQLLLVPQAFLFDARFTLARLNTLPLAQQAAAIVENIIVLFRQDGWMLAGLAGLVFLKPASARHLSGLMLVWPILLLGRTVALYGLSFYYMIPLLPLVALGLAALIQALAKHQPALGLAALMLVLAFFPASRGLSRQLYSGFVTPMDGVLLNPAQARAAAHFVNQHSQPDDVIIASPTLAWLLHSQVADFQMAVAAAGQATVHLPLDMPVDRFAFDPRYPQARYVIVDNLWRNWAAVHIPAVAVMMHTVEHWPIAFQLSEIVVYQNPSLIR